MATMATTATLRPCALSRGAITGRAASFARSAARAPQLALPRRTRSVVVLAAAEEATPSPAPAPEADDFENRLSSLRGKRSKRAPVSPEAKAAKDKEKSGSKVGEGAPADAVKAPPAGQKRKGVRDFTVVGSIEEPSIDWGPEEIKYEGPPARGEVVANLAMSWTVVWLPLTIAALGRALWVNYKITDKRVAIMSKSPLRTERTDVPMDQIVDIITVGRGIGLWGDVVITLKNQEKLEMRSLPDFQDIEKHIRERMSQQDAEFAKL